MYNILYKLAKMIVEKAMFLLLLIMATVHAGDDQLLKIGEKHTCIKQVVTVFVSNKNCNALDDASKSMLALKMTECLLLQMGKSLPSECEGSSSKSCKLQGDSWNTFSTFFTHIDNLCHFYWEMLHHERAELLIDKLSESSHNAQMLLKKNAHETERILEIQQSMHESLQHSLRNQKEMTMLINSSARHISNLTIEMESFVKRIHQDINENYGSVRNVLNAMNEGISQAIAIQSYMTAELTSIRGTLYFLCSFFLILFITSFKRHERCRFQCLTALAANILLQVTFSSWIQHLLGVHRLRYLFLLFELLLLWKSEHKETQLQQALSIHLNTPRLEKVFRKAIIQNQTLMNQFYHVSSRNFPLSKPITHLAGSPNIKAQQ